MCDKSQLVTSSHFLIRSADRNDYWGTTPSNFRINLDKPLKGSKAQISFCQIPNTYYNITTLNNQFYGYSNISTPILQTIAPGSYTLNDLMAAIQNVLSFLGTVTVTYDTIGGLITISNTSIFYLDFNTPNSIAKPLGFNQYGTYTGLTTYTGLQPPKLFDSSIYISCNFCTHLQTTSKLKNVSFIIPHNVNRGEIIQFYSATQFALQPHVMNQTIGIIEFTVFNENGELLQNLADWSIMIQII